MSRFKNNRVVSFRKFDKVDGDIYSTYDIAWPVEAIECYANKVSDGALDVLAETVLGLLGVKEVSPKQIANLLGVGDEVVNKIINDLEKSETPLYSSLEKKITKAGEEYLEKKETGEFLEEKVFGYVFVSRVEGDVFPYFWEGKLPWSTYMNNISYISFDEEKQSEVKGERSLLLDRVNRAYHKYGRITKASKEIESICENNETVEFIEEELIDLSYNEETTLANVEANKNIKNARIRLLNTKPTEINIRCRLRVSKTNPEKYIIDSPFFENNTSWYSECFQRMIANKELIYTNEEDEMGLDYFCEKITNQFYIDFPELQSKNFEYYVKINYPQMLSCSISKVCKEQYKEIFNQHILLEERKIKRSVVVTEETRAIELILNNYISRTHKAEIIDKYKKGITTENDLEDFFYKFGISDCTALFKEKKNFKYETGYRKFNSSIINTCSGDKNGNSVVDKYFYLIAEAFYVEDSKFRKILIEDGPNIVSYLDLINNKRNNYGAHTKGEKVIEMSKTDFEQFHDVFVKTTNILLEYFD